MLKGKSIPPFISFLFIVLMIASSVILWQRLYFLYRDNSGFDSDIFRHFFYANLPPAYGIDRFDTFSYVWFVAIIASYLFFFIMQRWLNSFVSISLFLVGFMLLLGATEPLRITHSIAHFATFLEDINVFSSVGDLLTSYVSKQNQLSIHGAHYPPGILMLLKILGTTYEFKIFLFVILISALYLFYIYTEKKSSALIALALIPAFLIYPTLDFVALPFFFFMLLLVLEKKSTSLAYGLMGVIFFVWSFFSFISFVGGVYILIYQLLDTKGRFSKQKIKLYLYAVTSFVTSYLVFKYVIGVDLLDCFIQSLQNNVSLNSSPFDSIIRYLIRSSGNYLNFALGAGLLFGNLFLTAESETVNRHRTTLLITLFLLSFSGLFYMETDRVWYCFLPIVAWIASDTLNRYSSLQKIIILSISILYLAVFELGFQLYT